MYRDKSDNLLIGLYIETVIRYTCLRKLDYDWYMRYIPDLIVC